MESEIAADAPLDYVTFQILPEDRYDVCICSNEKEEIMGHGPLDQLQEHLANMNDQLGKGSSNSFKLEVPDTIDHRAWFTKATLTRFLHIVNSSDSLKKSIAISNEMSQLEETRKFHLSLYAQAEDGITSTDNSKNELVRAMDSRLAALTEELVSTFNLAAGATFSLQEIMDLHKFCQLFGDVDIRNLLSKLSEASQKGQKVVPRENKKSPVPFISKNDYVNKTGGNVKVSKPSDSAKPVIYNASPAKAAELERQSSTDSEDSSSFSSEDDHHQPSPERSRTLIRSASPRRSASPMRRIQIGRSGSRRTPALTVKNLTCFPAREKIIHRDMGKDSKLEEADEPNKKTEVNVTRMSVQDAISLFESKQRDQTNDPQKQRSVVDNNCANTNKCVLRRWSSGMGESQNFLIQNMSEHMGSETNANLSDEDAMNSAEVSAFENAGSKETLRVDYMEPETSEKTASNTNEYDYVTVSQAEETSEKLDSAEWNRQKEEELNQMLMKFAEFSQSNLKNTEPDNNKNRNSRLEKKGGFYGHHKERSEKLKGQNGGKKAEKQPEPRIKQKVLEKPKATKSPAKKVTDVGKKQTTSRTPNVDKKTPLPLSSNSKMESPKPAVPKKAPSKSSSLPATRKSWPSTPSPRSTGALPLPSKIPTPSSVTTTTTAPRQKSQSPASSRQKPQSPAPLSRSTPRVERSQLQQKEVKKPQAVDTKKSLKKVDNSKTQVGPKSAKTMKAKTVTDPTEADAASVSPAKAVARKKVTKKSSVVPLEAKPSSTRRLSGVSPARSPAIQKTVIPTQAEETSSKSEDPVNIQEESVGEAVEGDPPATTKIDNGHLDQEMAKEREKANEGSEKEISDEGPAAQSDEIGDGERATSESPPSEIQASEEEPVISPAAWVESSQHEPSVPINDPSPVNPEPRVRHSLSQMLLEESSEPDIIEWGNAEIPSAMVYQKDAPKGLKRLLKFARKNKGEVNGASSWASPYTSEGEDDGDEYKSLGKRNSDNLLKVALHSKNYVEGLLSDSEPLSARSKVSNSSARSSNKFQDSHATSKGTRSFFSLSAFRGNKI